MLYLSGFEQNSRWVPLVTKGRLLPPPEWNPEEAALVARRAVGKVLTDEIYSQYVRKNLDLLEQGPHGIVW